MILAILLAFVFHGAHAQWAPCRDRCGLGEYQQITGVPDWLASRLRYDDNGVWEVEEGPADAWMWTPIREGDNITLTDKGVEVTQ